MTRRLFTAEAAARLGVTPQTLYAYVSRGVLRSQLADDGRSSTFDAAEVDAYRRSRRGKRDRADLETTVVSSLTRIDDHRVFYRERDVLTAACAGEDYESIASLLWNHQAAFSAPRGLVAACHDAQRSLPSHAPLLDRLRLNLAIASANDPLRDDRRTRSVASAAARAIAAMVDGLAPPARDLTDRLADRLLSRLSGRRRTARWRHAMNAGLVLLADHDLAASTLAARVAASARSHPYAVIGAGMGALTGPLHGTASTAVTRLLRDAIERGAAEAIAGALPARLMPGWGHALYPDGDPRAVTLFDLIADATASREALSVIEDVGAMVADRVGQAPNIDFALGAFAVLADLPDDAGSAIFAIARSAGWIAHALEEYEEAPLRFRPRSRYVRTETTMRSTT